MQTSKVAIVIVTWNKKAFVLELLASLQHLNYPNYDVIVVDNCSTDQTSEAILEHFPDTIIINNPENTGGAGGFNIGLQFAQDNEYTYCWLLDNDVVVDSDALLHLVNTLESTPNASICGSQILISGSETVQECGGNINWRKSNVILNKHGQTRVIDSSPDGIIEVDYCAACSMLVRMSDVAKYGKIDPEMFIFWDDIEWSTRIKSYGKQVLCNLNSVVWHHFNGYKPSTAWRVYYRIRNKFYFFHTYSKSKNNFLILLNIYEELSVFYKYLNIYDFAFAVDSAIFDFKNNIRGKWQTQNLAPKVSFNLEIDKIPLNNYFVIYDHDYGRLNSNSFQENSKHNVINNQITPTTLVKTLFQLTFQPSIAVGNQLNLFMLFSSFAILLTEEGSRIIQNNKAKNLLFISYRLGIFVWKRFIAK
jgi:GT2 family glycosyltransferase